MPGLLPRAVLLGALALASSAAGCGLPPSALAGLEPVSRGAARPARTRRRRARRAVAAGGVLLDVRTRAEYFVRHIDGARNIPLDELARRADELGPRDTPVVVYCLSGERSGRAARLLRRLGFTRVQDAGSMFAY